MVRLSRIGLAAVPIGPPSVLRSRKRMRHDGSNTLKPQDNREGLRALPLNWVECGKFLDRSLKVVGTYCLVTVPLYLPPLIAHAFLGLDHSVGQRLASGLPHACPHACSLA